MRTSLEKNLTPVPRTLSEANRDARYACAIQGFKSDTKLAMEFLEQALLGFIWVGLALGGIGGVIYWVML